MQNWKLLVGTIVGTLLLVVGVSWWLGRSSSAVQKTLSLSQEEVGELEPKDAWVRGASASARFTIVEFSDFQCPACAIAEPQLAGLVQQFPNDVRLVYRHFPLGASHPYGNITARFSEAAGKQGKFWEAHDLLFRFQDEWKESKDIEADLRRYAGDIGLDVDRVEQDWQSDEVRQRVERDLRFAERLRLPGTPSLFLNGQPVSLNELIQQVNAASQ